MKNMDLTECLRKKENSQIKTIEELLGETIKEKDRERAKYALSMAVRLYEELIKQKGTWYIEKVYPDIQNKINKVTDEFLEYNS